MHATRKYNRVKVELTEAGKLGAELAAALNVHASTVSDWCTNTNQPSIQDLYRIAEFLQTDVRNLLVPNIPRPASYGGSFPQDMYIAAEPEDLSRSRPRKEKAVKPKTKRKKTD